AIQGRRFREDLYHRLAVLTLTLPPLRDRAGDILMLAEHYLARACADYGVTTKTLAADAQAALTAYAWPGNVRELANLMERVALLSSDPAVTSEALGLTSIARRTASAPARPAAGGPASSLDDAVRDRVADVLRQTSWNISRTAALLGISRNTLRARIEKYGLRAGEAAAPPPRPEPRGPRGDGGRQRRHASPTGRRIGPRHQGRRPYEPDSGRPRSGHARARPRRQAGRADRAQRAHRARWRRQRDGQ